jgi:hypothetical protein
LSCRYDPSYLGPISWLTTFATGFRNSIIILYVPVAHACSSIKEVLRVVGRRRPMKRVSC